jgi:signal transduction histidine kinase/CHASE3 domain sensor protein
MFYRIASPLKSWWSRLSVQQKLWLILIGCFVPVLVALAVHLAFVRHLLQLQEKRHQVHLAREQIEVLRRLAVDAEDAFRGYLLTQQPAFLTPLQEAQADLEPVLARTLRLVAQVDGVPPEAVRRAGRQLQALTESKHTLIQRLQQGHREEVLAYVRSGQGLTLSDRVRQDLRTLEGYLDRELARLTADQEGVTHVTFWGLLGALAGGLALGALGGRLLGQSITQPLAVLRAAVERLGEAQAADAPLPAISVQSLDEIGQLARAYEAMAHRIRAHIRELEALIATGHDLNTIGPDGLDGSLRRIVDRAVDLTQADVCLVLLRHEPMGCWVVEAASGAWSDTLRKSVMLWEEFPVAVRAFDAREPAMGHELRRDHRPQVSRRNLIGDSVLAIPLLAQGAPFGVLLLLKEEDRGPAGWNVRLAQGLAQEAALAIANARLYEQAHQKQKDLAARLRQLEHLAETLAHDLKAPGKRMGSLAALLQQEYGAALPAPAARWLALIEENARELEARVESLLTVARVGARASAVEAVDAATVVHDVLKARAGELEARGARVAVSLAVPPVACHGAYLRQVFDNLLSNALKFARPEAAPAITIQADCRDHRVWFAVRDNGVGIPPEHRERVFQPFVRLRPDQAPGSGIGLTIVQRIVELYGGQVRIDANADGPGCTVTFSLPVIGDMTLACDLSSKVSKVEAGTQ